MDTLITFTQPPVVAAVGYSVIYMMLGGGLIGAGLIFVVAKLIGR